jgi:ACR3 family arsenite efflux pump ArsB
MMVVAMVIGPIIVVPVLIGLIYVALWIRRAFFSRLPLREGAS